MYERARTALVNQLRSVEPALDESDITRERLALEDAIRKVEAEAVKRYAARMPPKSRTGKRSYVDQGLRGFRETVADAEGLGGAAAAANRSAHEVYEAMPGQTSAAGRRQRAACRRHRHRISQPQPLPVVASAPPPPAPTPTRRSRRPLISSRRPRRRRIRCTNRRWRSSRCRRRSSARYADADERYTRPARSYGRVDQIHRAAAGAGRARRRRLLAAPGDHVDGGELSQRAGAEAARSGRAGRPAENRRPHRTGQRHTGPANAPAAAVAQKVVLYDEDPTDPKGKRYVGSALWRTETVSPGPGLAPELAIRADVEIPERHMRMTWSLRRNTDKALPASHTIEIMFTLPADFSEGGIGNVPGVLMKQDEQARGVPLAGLAVKVTNGYFLIGLSAVDVDVQRNIQLLKERDWFDIPIVYTSGKRAILAMEKGTPGVRAFEEAFRAWGE